MFKRLKEKEGNFDINSVTNEFIKLKSEELNILSGSIASNNSKSDLIKLLTENIDKRIEKYYNLKEPNLNAKF